MRGTAAVSVRIAPTYSVYVYEINKKNELSPDLSTQSKSRRKTEKRRERERATVLLTTRLTS